MIIYIYPCKTKYYIIIIVVFDVELQMSEFENKNGGCKEVFKKLKKVIATTVAAMMVTTFVPQTLPPNTVVKAADISPTVTVEVGQVSGKAGDTVTLPIYVKNVGQTPISGIELKLGLDSTAFELVDVFAGEFTGSWVASKTSNIAVFITGSGRNEVTKDGLIGEADVKIKSTAKDGDYSISVSDIKVSVAADGNQFSFPINTATAGGVKVGAGGTVVTTAQTTTQTTAQTTAATQTNTQQYHLKMALLQKQAKMLHSKCY